MENRQQKLQRYYNLAAKSNVLYWAAKQFNWRPRNVNGRYGWFQAILLGGLDSLYLYPEDWPETELRGKPIRKFAWRIGRQSGKTECLAIAALYLAICKPITEWNDQRYLDKSKVGENGPEDTGWRKRKVSNLRGASIIMASAKADMAKTVYERVVEFIGKSALLTAALEAGTIEIRLNPYPEFTIHVDGWRKPAKIAFRGPGANGQALRSKTFDYKLYDEADYMPNSFFEAEKPTSINAGDTGLTILSSTPTGKHEYFFKACFTEDAPVVLEDGTTIPIKDVLVGQKVLNRYGKPEIVTDIMNRVVTENLSKVSFTTTMNDVVVTGTSGHKVMAVRRYLRYCGSCETMIWKNRTTCILRGKHKNFKKLQPEYIALRDLQIGDYIAMPKNCRQYLKTNKSKYSDESNVRVEEGDFIYFPINGYTRESAIGTTVYNLTVGEDHSYLVNFYGVANCTDKKMNFEEFHFPSWENPNYTRQIDREFREELSAVAYEHEIMAEWGTTEYGVFDWTWFEGVFSHKFKIPKRVGNMVVPGEYMAIKLNIADVTKIGMQNLARYLKMRYQTINPRAKYYFGADLGYTSDPTEMVVFEQYNGIMKMILRIHLEKIPYDVQCDIIAHLDTHYMFEILGMDEGNAGVAVKQILQGINIFDRGSFNKYASHDFAHRLRPVQFGEKFTLGKVLGKEQKVPVKQWMTDLIIKQAEEGLLIMPNLEDDDELENQFRNHTYSYSSNGTIIYSKSQIFPDHIVDAVRTVFFAKQFALLPKARQFSVGSAFKSRGTGGWK